MAPRAMFVDPEGVWGDIMFDDRSQQKNKPVWGRGESRRAAPSMARGKRFAGEPRSDAANLGSSSDESDSGVSADEEVGPRPGLRQDARVVLQAGTRRSEIRTKFVRNSYEFRTNSREFTVVNRLQACQVPAPLVLGTVRS